MERAVRVPGEAGWESCSRVAAGPHSRRVLLIWKQESRRLVQCGCKFSDDV
jgi:hypothetical protein